MTGKRELDTGMKDQADWCHTETSSGSLPTITPARLPTAAAGTHRCVCSIEVCRNRTTHKRQSAAARAINARRRQLATHRYRKRLRRRISGPAHTARTPRAIQCTTTTITAVDQSCVRAESSSARFETPPARNRPCCHPRNTAHPFCGPRSSPVRVAARARGHTGRRAGVGTGVYLTPSPRCSPITTCTTNL